MPTAYTHQLIAEDSKEVISDEVRLADYYFGAQGADSLFFFRFIKFAKHNLGNMLHTDDIYGTFTTMLDFCRTHPEALSYVLGYITHCASDAVFHPYVYFVAHNRGVTKLLRSICHTRMETDLDSYFLDKLGISVEKYGLPYGVHDINMNVITELYVRVFEAKGVSATRKAVRHAIKNYFRYVRGTTDRRFRQGGFYGFLGKYSLRFRHLAALFRRRATEIDRSFLNEEHREWHYREDESRKSTDSVDELYEKAVDKCRGMLRLFLDAYNGNTELPREEFNTHLLKGINVD